MWTRERPLEVPLGSHFLLASSYTITDARAEAIEDSGLLGKKRKSSSKQQRFLHCNPVNPYLIIPMLSMCYCSCFEVVLLSEAVAMMCECVCQRCSAIIGDHQLPGTCLQGRYCRRKKSSNNRRVVSVSVCVEIHVGENWRDEQVRMNERSSHDERARAKETDRQAAAAAAAAAVVVGCLTSTSAA